MARSKDKSLTTLVDLEAAPHNPRRITEKALAGLSYSLAEFGDISGIVWNRRTGNLVAGHQRIKALSSRYGDLVIEGETIRTPEGHTFAVRVVDWSSSKAKAAMVAANSPTIEGEFTDDLGALLAEIATEEPMFFEEMDLSALLGGEQEALPALVDEDEAPPVAEGEPDSKQGEVYLLGPHRLMCGDCRDFGAWQKLLAEGERVNLVFTSPPYASQRKYDEASEFRPIPPEEYSDWWKAVQRLVREHLAPDGSFFVNIKEHCEDGERNIYCKELLVRHVREWGWRWVDEFAWTHGGTPGFFPDRFKNGWEPVWHLVFAKGFRFRPKAVRHVYRPDQTGTRVESYGGGAPADHDGIGGQLRTKRRKQLGSNASPQGSSGGGRMIQEAVADATAALGCALPDNVLSVGRNREALGHGAAFPVALPTFFVRAYSDPGDLVVDVFMGSGTTMIAAAQNGRRAAGFEISPRYCDVIRRRWSRWAAEHGQDPGPGALE